MCCRRRESPEIGQKQNRNPESSSEHRCDRCTLLASGPGGSKMATMAARGKNRQLLLPLNDCGSVRIYHVSLLLGTVPDSSCLLAAFFFGLKGDLGGNLPVISRGHWDMILFTYYDWFVSPLDLIHRIYLVPLVSFLRRDDSFLHARVLFPCRTWSC